MLKESSRCETFYANLHIAGSYQLAEQFSREFSYKKGYCVQIHHCNYVYTGGMESGLLLRVINYPRFKRPKQDIKEDFLLFSMLIAERLCQKSYTVEFADETIYFESNHPLHRKC